MAEGDAARHFEQWQALIHAFVCTSDRIADAGRGIRADADLSGLTVGVKDIIDVAGLPTRNGSDVCRDAASAKADAPVVASLRAAGARILGKTTTTEFAFTDPTACRNPYDLARTPGGSSSGSGAAVAAGMVDLALGTQTAGSLCRPAAYCGVVGFKPTYGVLPTVGVTPLSRSFDTVGIIATTVDIAARSFRAMAPSERAWNGANLPEMTAIAALPETGAAPSAEMAGAFQDAWGACAGLGLTRLERGLAVDAGAIVADHRVVMTAEASVAHEALCASRKAARLKPKFRAGLLAGAATSREQVEAARDRLATAKQDFWARLSDVDIIITLAVPEGAPLIDGTTGFQDWLTPWTVFGGPLVSLPWGLDTLGRPLSVMVAAAPGQDARLLTVAAALEQLAPPLPLPTLPQLN